jgi:hypothetical protein
MDDCIDFFHRLWFRAWLAEARSNMKVALKLAWLSALVGSVALSERYGTMWPVLGTAALLGFLLGNLHPDLLEAASKCSLAQALSMLGIASIAITLIGLAMAHYSTSLSPAWRLVLLAAGYVSLLMPGALAGMFCRVLFRFKSTESGQSFHFEVREEPPHEDK